MSQDATITSQLEDVWVLLVESTDLALRPLIIIHNGLVTIGVCLILLLLLSKVLERNCQAWLVFQQQLLNIISTFITYFIIPRGIPSYMALYDSFRGNLYLLLSISLLLLFIDYYYYIFLSLFHIVFQSSTHVEHEDYRAG